MFPKMEIPDGTTVKQVIPSSTSTNALDWGIFMVAFVNWKAIEGALIFEFVL